MIFFINKTLFVLVAISTLALASRMEARAPAPTSDEEVQKHLVENVEKIKVCGVRIPMNIILGFS